MIEEPTKRERVLLALQRLVGGDGFFPAPGLDEPEPKNWRAAIPGATVPMSDYATVQDGDVEVTRDGGEENSWELELKAKVVYLVQSADTKVRRGRRAAADRHITALIRGSRDLGLQDPQIYAEIEAVEHDDNVIVKATAPVAMTAVTVSIQFIADSVAG
jgi:hypothetical protein